MLLNRKVCLLLLSLCPSLLWAEEVTEQLDESLANEINHLDYLFTPGHIFPLFGTHPYIAEGLPEGIKPPLPYGITAGVFEQTQDIFLTDFQINSIDVLGQTITGIPDIFPALQRFTDVEVHIPNELEQESIRVDAWLLPIFNVFALYGKVEGKVSVDIKIPEQPLVGGGDNPLSALLGAVTRVPEINFKLFDVNYFGDIEGLGYTAAIGYKRFFATWTEVRAETKLDSQEGFKVESDSHVKNPRIGWLVSPKLSMWVGGLHLEVTRVDVKADLGNFFANLALTQQIPVVGGTLSDLLGGVDAALPSLGDAVQLDFSVALREEEPWNYLAGALISLTPNINIELEAGWGVREYAIAGLGFRF